MTTPNLENINVSAFDNMPTPAEIHAKLPGRGHCKQGVPHHIFTRKRHLASA